MQFSKGQNHRLATKVILLMIVVILMIIIGIHINIPSWLSNLVEWIENYGWWGIILFILLHLIGSIIAIPAFVMAFAGGFIFGLGRGIIIVSISSTMGATAAFLVARYLVRDWIIRIMEKHPRYKIIDEAIAREGWQIIGLIRLSPIIPYNILHFVFGITSVKLLHYIIASWIGMLPMTFMYVYAGSLASSLTQVGESKYLIYSSESWIFYILGFLITLTATIYVSAVVRRALKKKLDGYNS